MADRSTRVYIGPSSLASNPDDAFARDRILATIGNHETTVGLHVRVRGEHIVLGRPETTEDGAIVQNDRVRLTHLQGSLFGPRVMRHTGKWVKTVLWNS